jgi:hypothetical protein
LGSSLYKQFLIFCVSVYLSFGDWQTVLRDPKYAPGMHDQDYFNAVMKPNLRYAALDTSLFPNGSPYVFSDGHDPVRYPPPVNPMIIHFNYFPGKTKKKAMDDQGCWLGSTLESDGS